MPVALDNLKHVVVLMMENRSFDHMLGSLQAQDSRIDGVDGSQTNPDTNGQQIPVQPLAEFQSQLDPDPGHHYPDVDTQLFNGSTDRTHPTMDGFIKAYFKKRQDVDHSHKIMYYFTPDKLPVLTTLARKYAVFNRWFSSLPGPTLPNRAFAHFGTSFGKTDMSVFYLGEPYLSIYERLLNAGHTAKIYYTDQTIAMAFLLKSEPQMFGSFDQFLADCGSGNLPQYSFIEPGYADDPQSDGEAVASDQHPDHDVQAGEAFIASVYNAIRNSPAWESTALLIVYDEHGGIYDHVPPPACTPDDFTDPTTGFKFDRLGIRVPAVLVSAWVPEGTVIEDRVFEHASIPATVTKLFIGAYDKRSSREKAAQTFEDVLTLDAPRTDKLSFGAGGGRFAAHAMGSHVVSIPKVSPAAKNPGRPISGLLSDQVEHLHDVEMTLPPEQRTGIDIHSITTEGEAAAYMNAVMLRLKPAVGAAGGQ